MTRRVSDVMHLGVETIAPEDTVKHAAFMMQALDVGPLPVTENGRPVGIVTDRDIVVRAVAAGRDPATTPVREVMTAEPLVYVREDQSVDEAVALMNRHAVRRLPVLDREEKRLVGMLALADLARHAGQREQAEALEGVSRQTETETEVP